MNRLAAMISWKSRDINWVAVALTGDVGLVRPFRDPTGRGR
jgi:hypothetical protein